VRKAIANPRQTALRRWRLAAFFDQLGEERRKRIVGATIDMAGRYIKAIQDWLPNAAIIFDRFHVQRLASDAVDEVCKTIRDGAKASVKHTRFVLLKSQWNLTRRERAKLADVERSNKRLYRAYLLRETLVSALDYLQPRRAERALDEWLRWARRSNLEPFKRVARTIRKYRDGVLEYVRCPFTNAVVEGLNTRFRMVAWRAFGFHTAGALIAIMFLCCGGVELQPPLPISHT
jgi:transposase